MRREPRAVIIPANVHREITDEVTRKFPLETGGVLMGYSDSAGDVVVTHVIGPGPRAHHALRNFEPDYEFQEEEISKLFRDSGSVCEYLGDWHSHPRGPEALSTTDKNALMNISRHYPARCSEPIMCIVSGDGDWRTSIWQCEVSGRYRRLEMNNKTEK